MSGLDYGITIVKGTAVDIHEEGAGKVLRLLPEKGTLHLIPCKNLGTD